MQFFDQLNPGTVFFIMCFGLLILTVVMKIIEMVKGKALFSAISVDDVKDMVVDQDLDSYFTVLKDKTLTSWLREEVVLSERIGIKSLSDKAF